MNGGIGEKVRHVLTAQQLREHHCHWPGCGQLVPPAKWGCREHWYRLPAELRRRIWQTYRPGQEIEGRPSGAYIAVAREAQDWIAAHARHPARQQSLPRIARPPPALPGGIWAKPAVSRRWFGSGKWKWG